MGEMPHLLFVDDEESIRLTLPPVLQMYGFKVTCASTVVEALGLITQDKFDVLIADLNIGHPGDGFAIVGAMRSAQPDAVLFILTGYPALETALEAIRQQVHEYLVKPTEIEVLVEKIRSKLAKRTPAPHVIRKRLPDVVAESKDWIVEKWLELAIRDSETSAVSVSPSERKDHVPRLLDVAIGIARGKQINGENREASALHGATRSKQGYTLPLLIRERRFLQIALAECIQQNLIAIELSNLIPDMTQISGTVDFLLEDSVRAFVAEGNKRAPSRSAHKSRNKPDN